MQSKAHRIFPSTGNVRALVTSLLCVLPMNGSAQPTRAEAAAKDTPRLEPQVKAALLAKFLHYVQWPEQALPKPGLPITIGFLGADPIATELAGLISGGTYPIKGRPLAIKRSSRPDDLKNCQALFIPKSASVDLKAILAIFQGSGVLIVSDMDRFAANGGMIGFRNNEGRIRFEINQAAVRKEGLRIGADLLAMADQVK